MKDVEREVENQPTTLDYPAWVISGIVATLGVVDLITHQRSASNTVVSPSIEAIAFPAWAVWGMVRGHTWVLFDKIQHKLQKN